MDSTATAQMVWDAENRLISVMLADSTVVSYEYDYIGRRIAKTLSTGTTNFLYHGWNLCAEYTGSTLAKTYTCGMDLSGSMQGAGGVGGLLSVRDGSDVYYPTYDGNGNVSEYLDSTGTTVAHYEYDAFGNTTVSTGTKKGDFAHRFSTKYEDVETGLLYYGYRYYDPVTGRWLSRDPIGEKGGVNLYEMVGNDLVGNLDILGMAGYAVSVWNAFEVKNPDKHTDGMMVDSLREAKSSLQYDIMIVSLMDWDEVCLVEVEVMTPDGFETIHYSGRNVGYGEMISKEQLLKHMNAEMDSSLLVLNDSSDGPKEAKNLISSMKGMAEKNKDAFVITYGVVGHGPKGTIYPKTSSGGKSLPDLASSILGDGNFLHVGCGQDIRFDCENGYFDYWPMIEEEYDGGIKLTLTPIIFTRHQWKKGSAKVNNDVYMDPVILIDY